MVVSRNQREITLRYHNMAGCETLSWEDSLVCRPSMAREREAEMACSRLTFGHDRLSHVIFPPRAALCGVCTSLNIDVQQVRSLSVAPTLSYEDGTNCIMRDSAETTLFCLKPCLAVTNCLEDVHGMKLRRRRQAIYLASHG